MSYLMFVPAFSLATLALLGAIMVLKRRIPSRLRVAIDTLNATLLLISGIMLAIFLGIASCSNAVRGKPALIQHKKLSLNKLQHAIRSNSITNQLVTANKVTNIIIMNHMTRQFGYNPIRQCRMAQAAYSMLLVGGASYLSSFALSAKSFNPDKKSRNQDAGEGEGEAPAMSQVRDGEQVGS